jgi:hypothetical protein
MGYTPPHLEVRKLGGGWRVNGLSQTTGDNLLIRSNSVDDRAYILVYGNGGLLYDVTNTSQHNFAIDGDICLSLGHVTDDVELTVLNNHNINLKTQGTGKIKFGAYTPGLAVCTGTIATLDAAGNATRVLVAQP